MFASRQVGADIRICLHSRWKIISVVVENYVIPAKQVTKILANKRALAHMSHLWRSQAGKIGPWCNVSINVVVAEPKLVLDKDSKTKII